MIALFLSAGPVLPDTVKIRGDQAYEAISLKDLASGSFIDARGARFIVSNSRNPNPTRAADCNTGTGPVNRYPLQVRDSSNLKLVGGIFDGQVPMLSDWRSTYCNSSALRLENNRKAVISELRIRRAWDGIRITGRARDFRLQRIWLSEIRDDCIENDYLNGGMIQDVLFDGCFVGISVAPTSDNRNSQKETVTLSGVLMRMSRYLYNGKKRHGPPIKSDGRTTRFKVYDSVFAMESKRLVGPGNLATAWDLIGSCKGNLFLWLSDRPYPSDWARPPSCFRVIKGRQARVLWARIRQNWIDCHPDVARFRDDPESDPGNCQADLFGGQF